MKTPSKFFKRLGKRKGDRSLLADSPRRETSDFTTTRHEDETRNDEVKGDWLVMPYQIAKSPAAGDGPGSRQISENDSTLDFPDEVTNQDDVSSEDENEWKADKPHSPLKTAKADKAKPTPLKTAKADNSKATRDKSNNIPAKLTSESSGEDIFDDLDSIAERVVEQVDSLEAFMAQKVNDNGASRSTSNRLHPKSFTIDADSSDTSQKDGSVQPSLSSSTSPYIPVDPRYLKKKGILIVDPNKNGEVYRMDEQNKCLTDKELIIIGQTNGYEHGDDDDQTQMSNLTEVTYQKSKEERIKYIMQHLKDAAAHIPESKVWCRMFECPADTDIKTDSNEPANGTNVVKRERSAPREGPTMGQNTKLFFKSLYAVSTKGSESWT